MRIIKEGKWFISYGFGFREKLAFFIEYFFFFSLLIMIIFFLGLFIFIPPGIVELIGGLFALIVMCFALSLIIKLIRNTKNNRYFYILPIDLKGKLSNLSEGIEKMLDAKHLEYQKIEKKTYFNPYYIIYYIKNKKYIIRIQEPTIGTYEFIHVGPKIEENIEHIEEIKKEIEKISERLNIST
jgi:hypothetical protein